MPRSFTLCLFGLLTVVVVFTHSFAGAPEPVARFGESIAAGDGHLFLAEPGGFKNPGMVHVYVRGEDQRWTLQTSLQGPDAHVGDDFGNKIAYEDGVLAITGSSNVFVFKQQDGNFVLKDRLTSETASRFGSALALDRGWLAVSVAQTSPDTGSIHLFHEDLDGKWTLKEVLEAPSETAFSPRVALAMDQGRLLIGDPEACTAYLYEYLDTAWGWTSSFPCKDVGPESAYGAEVLIHGDHVIVGAPGFNAGAGAVSVWHSKSSQQPEWTHQNIITPSESSDRTLFGVQIEVLDSRSIVVGAPLSNDMDGELRIYAIQENGEISPEYTALDGEGSMYGSVVAVDESMIVVGIPGAAYGEGSAELLELNDGIWQKTQTLFNASEPMPTTAQKTCDGGRAAGFECGLMDLVAFLPNQEMEMNRGVRLSDVWGWTDPETGIEYGLIGHLEGTVFVDLKDPATPIYLGTLPRTEGSPGSTWRDIKVYKDHAFVVADRAGEHGIQIFDLTQLRDLSSIPTQFEASAHYDRIHSAHNIVINEETGFAFAVGASGGGETCGGGLHMIDIREPQAPVFAGCFADETTGRRKTGYSHDAQCVIYNGPDTEYTGREICIGANETAISISDVTDKTNPVAIGTGSYPDAAYVHQGWLTEDHAYFYQNDELDELTGKVEKTRTLVWDVRDLSDPILVREFFGPTSATDHNLYVHGEIMYQTNNASGLRMIDISSPEDPVEIGFFDTTPYGTDDAGFNGTWSSFPYFESGMILVTSRREGIFILKKQPIDI